MALESSDPAMGDVNTRGWTARPPVSACTYVLDPVGPRGRAGGPSRGGEPQPHHLRRKRHDLVLRRRARGGPEGAGDAVFHEPHVPRLADGDEDELGGA